jgi:aromatic-amino-acid transaminase
MFERLEPQPPDALLALIGQFRDDTRAEKIDLGVGVYRDEAGHTPVFKAVKGAERQLAEDQPTKAYLGPEGNRRFTAALAPVVLGAFASDARLAAVQTPGGTGALRLAADLIAAATPDARVWMGTPSWPNHPPLMRAAGLELATYRHFDPARQSVCFDEMMTALEGAVCGDVVLLHGCCHNPTGADLDDAQWTALVELLAKRGLVPLLDLAYQGLGDGLEADAKGVRAVMERLDEALLAYSCDKNFGLYRERTGALFLRARDAGAARSAYSNALACARANWSMPPDHGAEVVARILESETLNARWLGELDGMRARIADVRKRLAAADPVFAPLARQKGMFSLLPVDTAAVSRLKSDHAVYMAGSGRINVCGLAPDNIDRFVAALREQMAKS